MKRNAPLSVWRPLNIDHFLLGAPHYPEHVDESYWQRDAARLAAAGANTVRMGEFAWHIWEPHEGHFDFNLFDRAIAVLGDAGASYSAAQVRTALLTSKPGDIIIAHMNHPEAGTGAGIIAAMPELKKRGFRFVKLSDYPMK